MGKVRSWLPLRPEPSTFPESKGPLVILKMFLLQDAALLERLIDLDISSQIDVVHPAPSVMVTQYFPSARALNSLSVLPSVQLYLIG